jgi:hypothetical protein
LNKVFGQDEQITVPYRHTFSAMKWEKPMFVTDFIEGKTLYIKLIEKIF